MTTNTTEDISVKVDVNDDDFPTWLEILLGTCAAILALAALACIIAGILWCCGCLRKGCCRGGGDSGFGEKSKWRSRRIESMEGGNRIYWNEKNDKYILEDRHGHPYFLLPVADTVHTEEEYMTTRRKLRAGEVIGAPNGHVGSGTCYWKGTDFQTRSVHLGDKPDKTISKKTTGAPAVDDGGIVYPSRGVKHVKPADVNAEKVVYWIPVEEEEMKIMKEKRWMPHSNPIRKWEAPQFTTKAF